MGSGASTSRGGAAGADVSVGRKAKGAVLTSTEGRSGEQTATTRQYRLAKTRVPPTAKGAQTKTTPQNTQNEAVTGDNLHRVYTFTEETDNQNKENVTDKRNLKSHNLIKYNEQREPESVLAVREEHRHLQNGNTTFEGHTTHSSYVKRKITSVTSDNEDTPLEQPSVSYSQVDYTRRDRSVKRRDTPDAGILEGSSSPTRSTGRVSQATSQGTGTRPRAHAEAGVPSRSGSASRNCLAHVEYRRCTSNRSASFRNQRAPRHRVRTRRQYSYGRKVRSISKTNSLTSEISGGSSARQGRRSTYTLTDGESTSTMGWTQKKTSRSSSHSAKTGQVLTECKVRYLGRYLTQELNGDSLMKLRSHISMVTGLKTKLRLTTGGIHSGNKYGTLFKRKVPVESVPFNEIYDICVDEKFLNLLLVITHMPGGSFDILAYRVDSDFEGRQMQHHYTQMVAFKAADNALHVNPVQGQDNWIFLAKQGGQSAFQNGGVTKANSVSDILESQPARGHDSTDWVAKRSRSLSQDRFTARARDLSVDRMSRTSTTSMESMNEEIITLRREVQELRSLVEARNRQGDGASLQEQADDEVFQTLQFKSDRPPGKQVGSNFGTVKIKVGDYRKPKQTQSSSGVLEGTSSGDDGPIRVVYNTLGTSDIDSYDGPIRMVYNKESASNGDVHDGPIHIVYNGNSLDSSDSGIHRGRGLSRDPSTTTNASQGHTIHRGTVRQKVAQNRDSSASGAFATIQHVDKSPGPSRSASHTSSDYPSMNRARTHGGVLQGVPVHKNVYVVQGSRPTPHGSRASRSRQHAVYLTHPENPYVATSGPSKSMSSYPDQVHYF